jgi:hypothetical protein
VVESNVVVDHFPARNDLASALDGGSSLLSAGSDELAAWDENVNDSISLLSVSKPQNVNDSGSNSGANGSSTMSSMMDSQFTTFSDIASDGSVVKLTTVAVPPTNNNNNNNNNNATAAAAAAAAPGSLQPYTLHVYDRLVLQSRQRKESFRVKTQNEKEEALERRMPVSGAFGLTPFESTRETNGGSFFSIFLFFFFLFFLRKIFFLQPEMKRQQFESGQWASEPMMMRPNLLPATLKAYTGIDATERKP